MKFNIFKRKVFSFIPFIGLAILFWVSSILTKQTTYTKEIWIEVIVPDSLIMLDPNIYSTNVTLNGTGLELISVQNYNKTTPLKVHISSNNEILTNEKVINSLNKQFSKTNIDIEKVIFTPKVIRLDSKIYKTIPIKFSGDIKFKKLFGLLSGVKLDPKTVNISGPKSILKNIYEYKTIPKKYTEIQKTISEDILLIKPKDIAVKIDIDKVKITVPVEELTEKTLTIPIRIEGNNNKNIEIIPANVELAFMVGVSKYDNINMSDFSATIYINENIYESSNYHVSIVKKPSNITIQYIRPNYVDVYLKNKKDE